MTKNTDLANFDTSLPVANIVANGTISVGANVVVNTTAVAVGTTAMTSGLVQTNALIAGNLSSGGSKLRVVESGGTIYVQTGNGTSESANNISFAKYFSTNSTFTIDLANQRVGIGTIAPGQTLTVNGTFATGNTEVTGSVNATSLSVGTNFIANTTQTTVAVPLAANGSVGTAGHVLTSNGATGAPYWAAAAAGVNTAAQYSWTNTHTFNGGLVINNGYTEEVFAITDGAVALSPTNGSIQTWTLGANRTPTQGTWAAGQSLTLMIDDGSAFTVTWTSVPVTWVAGAAPVLATTGFTAIVLWKVGTVVYGARAG